MDGGLTRENKLPWPARLAGSWIVRSLAVGAVSSGVDYALVYGTSTFLAFPAAFAALCGLGVGTVTNFLLNRRFAFKDSGAGWAGAAVRYFGALGCLMLVHATAVGLLTERAGLHILLAKLVADVTLLSGGQLLVLRYIVFPRNKTPRPAVARSAAETA